MTAHPTDDRPVDLLGRELTDDERALLAVYRDLAALLDRDDLSPAVAANVREAVAALWQAVNDLALTAERPPL